MASFVCPLCQNSTPCELGVIDAKRYGACDVCGVRFLAPEHFLSPDEERQHYDSHENHVDDPGYRAFLSRLATPLLMILGARPCKILDYGCGPGPALAAMLREAGHAVTVYDPIFAPDTGPLDETYDVITCTEVAEHFHNPAKEFATLNRMLRPGGWLAIMTCFQADDARFAAWHYRKDPTHVVFYRVETFRWLARHFGWRFENPRKDVALLQKPRMGCIVDQSTL